ncbi:hypothetical protein D2M30_3169 [Bacillus amyloliquefaciens]|nr:hypothetical protein D2M30_3169 [Bacillus amyloliquefaciens]
MINTRRLQEREPNFPWVRKRNENPARSYNKQKKAASVFTL